MTTPTPLLYAPVGDLLTILTGTDDTGTAAQLTEAQLTLALQSASSRISVYAGNIFDSSSPGAVPPPIFHDLCLDLAAFWAYKMYLKGKDMEDTHPVYLAYKNAMQVLEDARDGKVRLDPAVVGAIGQELGVVINRIPPIFTGKDSNTRIDAVTGTLKADTSFYDWSNPDEIDWGSGGPVYQG